MNENAGRDSIWRSAVLRKQLLLGLLVFAREHLYNENMRPKNVKSSDIVEFICPRCDCPIGQIYRGALYIGTIPVLRGRLLCPACRSEIHYRGEKDVKAPGEGQAQAVAS